MTDKKNILVVGTGSIALRHIDNLKTLNSKIIVSCISSSGRKINPTDVGSDLVYKSFDEALKANIAQVIVASPASMHIDHCLPFIKKRIPVLVEKPLASNLNELKKFPNTFEQNDSFFVAYNLRFLESLQKFKDKIDSKELGEIHSVFCEVGQYLPDWRKSKDASRINSARF